MIFIGSKEACEKYSKQNNIDYLDKLIHPSDSEKEAKILEKSDKNVICYNTVILDYIDPYKIYFINDDLTVELFKDKFEDKLNYLHPGEIILSLF